MPYESHLDFKVMFTSYLRTEANAQKHKSISNYISLDYLIKKPYSAMSN